MLYNPTALFNNTWILNCKSELIIIVFFADAIISTITSNEQQNHKMYKNSPITNLKPCPLELVEVNFCFLRFLLRWLMATKDANVSWLLNFRVCMFFKRTARTAFKEQGIPYLYKKLAQCWVHQYFSAARIIIRVKSFVCDMRHALLVMQISWFINAYTHLF